MNSAILGTGSCLPKTVLSNDDLAKMVDTSDAWIRERTGIVERHIAREETLLDLAHDAAVSALEGAGVAPDQLSALICATITPDTTTPSLASALAAKLGVNCMAFDLNAACSGFVYALTVADALRKSGQYALVLGAEKLSRVVDWSDRSTCVLFGDGAGAVVLGDCEDGGLIASRLATWSDDLNVLHIEGINHNENGTAKASTISMDGQEVFKFATRTIPAQISETLQSCDLTPQAVKWIIPHQANQRIVQLAATRLNLPLERFYMNIDRVGNTSSASIPMALHELNANHAIERGDIVVLAAFGGGLTAGTAVFRW